MMLFISTNLVDRWRKFQASSQKLNYFYVSPRFQLTPKLNWAEACISTQQCIEGNPKGICPILKTPFQAGQPVYVRSEKIPDAIKGLPVIWKVKSQWSNFEWWDRLCFFEWIKCSFRAAISLWESEASGRYHGKSAWSRIWYVLDVWYSKLFERFKIALLLYCMFMLRWRSDWNLRQGCSARAAASSGKEKERWKEK